MDERLAGAAEHHGRVERGGKLAGKALKFDRARQRLLEDGALHEPLLRHRVAWAEDAERVAAVGELDVDGDRSHRPGHLRSPPLPSDPATPGSHCQESSVNSLSRL